MRKIIFLLTLMVAALCTTAHAQDFEQVINRFEQKEGAEVMRVSGVMMKLAATASSTSKEFMKRTNSMMILDMEQCSRADKEEFAATIKSLQLVDAEVIKQTDKARAFFRQGEKRNELIVATYDDEAYFLTLMRGRFDKEEAARNIVTRKMSDKKE